MFSSIFFNQVTSYSVGMSSDIDRSDLVGWKGRAIPNAEVLEGKYTRLEKLSVALHSDRGLFEAVAGISDGDIRFRHLPDYSPANKEEYCALMKQKEESKDPMFYATIDKATGVVGGYISIMRVVPEHGVYEIGHVYMGPSISRTRVATEAVHLLLKYAFDQLEYRRVEWKCDSLNVKSRAAALRFGFQFEGLFRKHLVVKGVNRDTTWFSMTDDDWKGGVGASFSAWLDETNFTPDAQQIKRLESFRNK